MVANHPQLKKLSEKAVLNALRIFMNNETGHCYPTQIKIAEYASCTDRTVRDVLKKAERLGIIKRNLIRSSSGNRYPHHEYWPLIPGENKSDYLIPAEIKTELQEIKTEPQEIKTEPQEINSQNLRNNSPTNYPYKYPNNYYVRDKSEKRQRTPEEVDKFREGLLKALKII
jgi:hypothetical protein